MLARTKTLSDQALASAADLQTADTNVAVAKAATDVAKATLAQSSASLHQAQVNLSYTEIYSPIDGTVISRAVDVGQTVAASLQAPVLFTIAEDLHKMQVHTSVAEGDVGRLQPGMDATFTVDAFQGQTLQGQGRPDPQRGADAPERRHLRRRDRRRERRPEASPRHDRDGDDRVRREGGRRGDRERRAPLPSAAGGRLCDRP